MSSLPFPDTAQDAVQGHQAADVQRYRGVLHTLIDMGAQLATAVHAKAMRAIEAPSPAQPSPAQPSTQANTDAATAPGPNLAPDLAPDLTIAFERVARTVRRTVLLARHIAEPLKAPRPYAARGPIQAQARQHAGRTRARTPGHRSPGDETRGAVSSQAKPSRHDAPESLERPERPERLELSELDAREIAETFADEIGDQAIEAIIAQIRRDLGQYQENPGNTPPPRRARRAASSADRSGPGRSDASATPAPKPVVRPALTPTPRPAATPRPVPHRGPTLDPPPAPMPDRAADPPGRKPGAPGTTTPASQACVNAPA